MWAAIEKEMLVLKFTAVSSRTPLFPPVPGSPDFTWAAPSAYLRAPAAVSRTAKLWSISKGPTQRTTSLCTKAGMTCFCCNSLEILAQAYSLTSALGCCSCRDTHRTHHSEWKGSWKVLLSEKIDQEHCGSRFSAPEWKQELLISMKVYKSLPGLRALTLWLDVAVGH